MREGSGNGAGPSLAEAWLALGLHMVESRIRLFGDLAGCASPLQAGEVFTRWLAERIEEFGADQSRVMEAWLRSLARAGGMVTMRAEAGMARGVGTGAKGEEPERHARLAG
ncbi:MAG: hypothetical protein RML45_02485 [Acetobacteraceae bacterium]|nr:hypothetical protein [Acetobacteraceae bacterium]